RFAQFSATATTGDRMPTQTTWSHQIIWGNHRLSGGYLNPDSNAWANNIVWGMAKTLGDAGDNIVWGMGCDDCDNIVWGMADSPIDNSGWVMSEAGTND